jgi:hypothetical protein
LSSRYKIFIPDAIFFYCCCVVLQVDTKMQLTCPGYNMTINQLLPIQYILTTNVTTKKILFCVIQF